MSDPRHLDLAFSQVQGVWAWQYVELKIIWV
jgi:hypothetical protein